MKEEKIKEIMSKKLILPISIFVEGINEVAKKFAEVFPPSGGSISCGANHLKMTASICYYLLQKDISIKRIDSWELEETIISGSNFDLLLITNLIPKQYSEIALVNAINNCVRGNIYPLLTTPLRWNEFVKSLGPLAHTNIIPFLKTNLTGE